MLESPNENLDESKYEFNKFAAFEIQGSFKMTKDERKDPEIIVKSQEPQIDPVVPA